MKMIADQKIYTENIKEKGIVDPILIFSSIFL